MFFPCLNEIPIQALLLRSVRLATATSVLIFLSFGTCAQRRPTSGNGQQAVVVDERLALLRDQPNLSGRLLKRLSRGRHVSVISVRRSTEGVTFYRVAVTRRTRGWIQREALVSPARKGEDERLVNLINASNDFDRIARACIFLEAFPRSPYRPAVLLTLANAAEKAARKLSHDAARRLDEAEMKANPAAPFSYFLNFGGLDRYRRLGVDFVYDDATKQYHYDGKSWREIVRRYPRSTQAVEARRHLDDLASSLTEKGE